MPPPQNTNRHVFVCDRRQNGTIEADFHLVAIGSGGGLRTGSDGSMIGHSCASKNIAVAAIDVVR